MKITEKLPEKKICLKKFDFSCDDLDLSIPAPLPQALNFFMIISGRPGSGKSSLILNLICKRGKLYNKKYDRIYLFSPSLSTMKGNPFEDLPEDQKFDELDEDVIGGVLDEISDTGEKVLFILDDVVNDLQKNTRLQRRMCEVCMNRRHKCGEGGSLSIIITTQVYNKIPAPIRKTASHVFIYHTKNKKELETIFDELILIPKKDYYELLKYVFKKKHDFLYIDIDKSFDKMFHRNFNQLEIGDSQLDYADVMTGGSTVVGGLV